MFLKRFWASPSIFLKFPNYYCFIIWSWKKYLLILAINYTINPALVLNQILLYFNLSQIECPSLNIEDSSWYHQWIWRIKSYVEATILLGHLLINFQFDILIWDYSLCLFHQFGKKYLKFLLLLLTNRIILFETIAKLCDI